jgi:DNA-directed RNA polymerase specialized sigma24 family protein
VERHGPMVHRVCQHVLGNPHDADDAFQATFIQPRSLLSQSRCSIPCYSPK